MIEPPSRPPTNTFIVHFLREWSAAGSRWRGRIEHVQSGERAAFLDLAGLVGFLQRLGVTIPADSGGSPGAGPKRC
jgi:hypothetical protein